MRSGRPQPAAGRRGPGPGSTAGGTGSGATTYRLSPPIRSGSRLVARTRTPGQSASSRAVRMAADSITCSQLSRISSASRSARAAQSRSSGSAAAVRAPPGNRPLAQAERVEDRVRHLGRLRHRGERGERGRAGEPGETAAGQSPGRLRRQPGLAHAARPGQRDQALGGELLQHADHIGVPADEAGRLTPAAAAAGSGVRRRRCAGVGGARRLGAPGHGVGAAVAAGISCRRTAM